MTEITRKYDAEENAKLAIEKLRYHGFPDDLITLKKPGPRAGLWEVGIRPPFGRGRIAMEILDGFDPIPSAPAHEGAREPGLQAIHELSKAPSPGAISRLSGPVSPGAIATLSRYKAPGAISSLSRWKSPGAISKLSGWKSPGAISRLSRSLPNASGAKLPSSWLLSEMLGLPLLTRSQRPLEPDRTLLVK